MAMASWGKWLGMGGIKDFPYDIGDVVFPRALRSHWQLRTGKKQEDGTEVSIFEHVKGASSDELELAENGMKKCKTLMLPGFLKCIASAETPTSLYVATESVVPLQAVLSSDEEFTEGGKKREEFIAWGLYQVIKGLGHIHQRKTLHGNVSRFSIFVTKSGDWRIWGLDWVTNLIDPTQQDHFKKFANYLGDEYKSPELAKGNWGVIESSPVHAIDAWNLACLIYEIFNGTISPDTKPADMKSPGNIPRTLYGAYTGLLANQAKMRTDPAKLLTDCDFFCDSTYIRVQLELEELSLKDQAERDSFFRRLAGHVDDFPLCNCMYTILPSLTTALQFGAGGSSALEPILRIGTRLGDEDYAKLVVPGVVSLFTSPEPIVRMKLLQNIDAFAQHLPSQMLSGTIWPHLATGFTNKMPEIRELTIKAMIPVVPLLKPTLVEDASRQLYGLQTDREGGIRTNATICLGKIAVHLPPASRSKILLQAFGRVLKDPFKQSRIAGLGSFAATADSFSAEVMAKQILPNVMPLTVDPEKEVRTHAFRCISTMLEKIQTHNDRPLDEVAASSAAAPEPQADGWGGWAASAVSKLRGGSEEPARPQPQIAKITPQQPKAEPEPVPIKAAPKKVEEESNGWGDDDDAFGDDDPPAVVPAAPAVESKPIRPSGLGMKAKKKGLGGVKKLD
eukprot:TRINITY_DN10176_c0_g1_i1.p1 TRINITY_DN10176_c0_g1~~TRINITY_DN10176_c0_g1_i1.p1  ORF type:complete len:699 (+),score=294.50 TRINITY_DN10176_c0_g1_i1:69-2099(+)